jgi:hypothetical protein
MELHLTKELSNQCVTWIDYALDHGIIKENESPTLDDLRAMATVIPDHLIAPYERRDIQILLAFNFGCVTGKTLAEYQGFEERIISNLKTALGITDNENLN